MTETRDYKDTVFLPKTDFPMKAGLPQKEPVIAAKWEAEKLYEQLRDLRRGRPTFMYHDGPPYANGDMHIGHALNHTIKDMVCRTQNLLGRNAPYVPGWDCHGLPIEWKVEEQYRKKKLDKDKVPLLEFRAECRAYAQHWVDVQRGQLKRMGVMADWDNPYLTMQPESEATIVAELLKFATSGQLYRGAKPVMWSPVEKTALAEAEVEYEDIISTQIDVAFEIVDSPIAELIGAYAVIWTTTPWTIPVNQAIAYGPEVEYRLYRIVVSLSGMNTEAALEYPTWKVLNDRKVILAADDVLKAEFESRLREFWPGAGLVYVDEWSGKGSDLAGTIARHPMANFFSSPLVGEAGGGRVASATHEIPSSDASAESLSAADAASPHPNPPHKGEGIDGGLSYDPTSPLAEFFLRPRPFLPGDFVTTDSGTGLVHMAPDHGEDDFDLCKRAKEFGWKDALNPVFAVEGDGKYRADWAWPSPSKMPGQGSVINPKFNAPDGPICADLRAAGALLAASADYKHSYPHSWRSKAKVIYRCTPQWFVPMDKPIDPSTIRFADGPPPRAGEVSEPPRHGEGDQPQAGGGVPRTLRQIALAELDRVQFTPDKGRNRIGSMVAGRPDWVLSRQRAWGVPITLFINRKTGDYLVDEAVNARIVAAVRAQGIDAWTPDTAHSFLGPDYDHDEWEVVSDILDVWFDSGTSHAYVLDSGRWPDLSWPADIYVEGSDQHRGWFQSSLLESCATRGHAPYDRILTHGFTMDAKGMKMSKSLGNTIDPVKVMETYGADIIRLWALSVDFTEDHRIGDEILKGVSDQYRKIRNTFRYMLGALDGFSEDERVADVAAMPELEQYMLHRLAAVDATMRLAVDTFDFNTYVRTLADFCNDDLSAFYFDIRKDCLYCDVGPAVPLGTDKRRAYRTVLDTLFHALVRYAAPVLVFTAEEVWGTRYPDGRSVHLLEWPVVDAGWLENKIHEKIDVARNVRGYIYSRIEILRQTKEVGSSLEVSVSITLAPDWKPNMANEDWAELLICADVNIEYFEKSYSESNDISNILNYSVTKTTHHKCGRCWRHLPEVTDDGSLCNRCATVLGE